MGEKYARDTRVTVGCSVKRKTRTTTTTDVLLLVTVSTTVDGGGGGGDDGSSDDYDSGATDGKFSGNNHKKITEINQR